MICALSRLRIMRHKFAVGESVQFRPAVPPIDMARGVYIATMLLPEIEGELGYRIRNPHEPHERISKESELREA
jgi:hypothetical protein